MEGRTDPGIEARLRLLSRIVATAVVAAGAAVLLGWFLDIPVLKAPRPDLISMKGNTALACAAAGLSLLLYHLRLPRLGAACAGGVVLGGLATAAEYLLGWDHFDHLVVTEPPGAVGTVHPGRMAPNTAAAFLLIGGALFLLHFRVRRRWLSPIPLALGSGSIALLACIGYAYSAEALSGVEGFTHMAVHTAWSFLALSAATLIADPSRGFMSVMARGTAGGALARRLVPAAIVVPIGLGWLRLEGEERGFYGTEFGVALVATLTAVLISAVVLVHARTVDRGERERRQVEEALRDSEQRLKSIIDNTTAVIYVKDAESRYLLVNRRFASLFGADGGSVAGKTDHDFFPAAMADAFRANDRLVVGSREPIEREEIAPHPDGPHTYISVKVPLFDAAGAVQAVCGISTDITEQKRAQESIRALNLELERRTAELEVVNRELEAFSYSASHDLRAPLRTLDGFSLALLEDCGDGLNETGRKHLQRIRNGCRQMEQIIEGLLTLSRVTRSEISQAEVDLSGMAGEIAGELRQAQPERQVEVAIQPRVVARGDRRLLHVVLHNLISNAWKFTSRRERGRIEFGISPGTGPGTEPGTEPEPIAPIYFVRDDGAGFDMTYAGKLFAPFQRLHGAAEFPGTGIGLATVQRIVHRHGGRVWAEGAANRGATFYFTLGGRRAGSGPRPA